MKERLPYLRLILLALFINLFLKNTQAQNNNSWLLAGNAGTIAPKNFLGTIDAQSLLFKVNNQNAGFLEYRAVPGTTTFGYQALNSKGGKYNSAFGYATLYTNSRGSYNTATGYMSLYSNTKGSSNTANGVFVLYSNTTGHNNTSIGFSSLYSSTTGNYNIAAGDYSLNHSTTGIYNTGLAYAALYYNTTGNYNTATGSAALYYNTSGYLNTANGYRALVSNTTGSYNTAVGYNAGVTTGNLNNSTAIGNNAIVDASNKVRIGNTSVTSIGGEVSWSTFSDGRYKKNIKNDVKGLSFINLLKPITYTVDFTALTAYYNNFEKHDSINEGLKVPSQYLSNEDSKNVYNGFIAQDVEKAAQLLYYNFSGVDKPQNKDGLYALRYSDFVVPLVKAVQELSSQNDSLKKDNELLNSKLDTLNTRLNKVENLLNSSNFLKSESLSNSNISLDEKNISYIKQNIPNPFSTNTVIKYYLSAQINNAQIIITDVSGNNISVMHLKNKREGQITITADTLPAGSYFYSLWADGKKIDAKQMILTK